MKNKIGRNDKCFCGSNLKYKKCCLGKNVNSKKETEKYKRDYSLEFLKENEFYKKMDIYHITIPKYSKEIEKNGLIGCKGNKFCSLSEIGFIYGTLLDNKSVWDDIKFHQIYHSKKDCIDSIYNTPIEKDYCVYKLNGNSLLKRGITIYEDFNDGISNRCKSVKFYIGKDCIPFSELEFIGNFKTNPKNTKKNMIKMKDENGKIVEFDFLNNKNIPSISI